MRRKRRYIPLAEKLAAALACLLPQDQRDDLRSRKVTAKQVVSFFEFHHIAFHAIGGSDKWYNLHPMEKAPHRERSKSDTSVVSKVRRVDETWSKFTASLAKGRKPPKKKSRWQSRPFQPRRKSSWTP